MTADAGPVAEGLINFRDFGGQPTRDGALVRRDMLYRSGHIADADASGTARLEALDFGVIADLRYLNERETDRSRWGRRWAERVLTYEGDITESPHGAMLAAAVSGVDAIDRSYADLYGQLPFDPGYRSLFSSVLRRAADGEGRILIHCTAGKDRTGILAALFLDTLGVSRADIVSDYLLSAGAPQLSALRQEISARVERSGLSISDRAMDTMLGVKARYLEAALTAMEQGTGSLDAYLDGGGVDAAVRDRLRSRFVD